jgi:proteasome lid subunit RPN8/RPN11
MLYIFQSVSHAIRAHGEETYPHECCGVLLGSHKAGAWHITASIRTENAERDTPHNFYRIAPKDLVRITREAHQRGLEIAGFYHSHPDHPAQWSPADLAEAHWLECVYIITAVTRGQAAQTNAFLLTGPSEEQKQFLPLPIQIVVED